VSVESCDKLLNPGHDLLAEQPFSNIFQKAKNGEYDGGHAGGSFYRARYNTAREGPGPVRSGSEVYGLASNSRAQQQEADRGTVMAVRSAIVINEIIQSQRRRSVPSAGTLENPPGSETGRKALLGRCQSLSPSRRTWGQLQQSSTLALASPRWGTSGSNQGALRGAWLS